MKLLIYLLTYLFQFIHFITTKKQLITQKNMSCQLNKIQSWLWEIDETEMIQKRLLCTTGSFRKVEKTRLITHKPKRHIVEKTNEQKVNLIEINNQQSKVFKISENATPASLLKKPPIVKQPPQFNLKPITKPVNQNMQKNKHSPSHIRPLTVDSKQFILKINRIAHSQSQSDSRRLTSPQRIKIDTIINMKENLGELIIRGEDVSKWKLLSDEQFNKRNKLKTSPDNNEKQQIVHKQPMTAKLLRRRILTPTKKESRLRSLSSASFSKKPNSIVNSYKKSSSSINPKVKLQLQIAQKLFTMERKKKLLL